MVLQFTMHHQQRAMTKREGQLQLVIVLMADQEVACGTEAHGGDGWVLAQLGLIIGMPADFVLPIAIPVEQDTVECQPCAFLHLLPDGEQGLIPWVGGRPDA